MREKITEAEINALLRGLAGVQRDQDPQDPQQQTEELRSPGEPLPFFIPAKEHLHQRPWPGLQVINEQFARLAPEALIGLLPQVSNMIALPLRVVQIAPDVAHVKAMIASN